MSIFIVRASYKWGSGIAVVAAQTKETAILLATPLSVGYGFSYSDPSSVELSHLKCDAPTPQIIAHFEAEE